MIQAEKLNEKFTQTNIAAFYIDMVKDQSHVEELNSQVKLLTQLTREIQELFNEFIYDVKSGEVKKELDPKCTSHLRSLSITAIQTPSNSNPDLETHDLASSCGNSC